MVCILNNFYYIIFKKYIFNILGFRKLVGLEIEIRLLFFGKVS